MMYVGLEYSSDAVGSASATTVCSGCGHQDAGRTVADGQGVGIAPYFLGRRAAAEEAVQSAVKDATGYALKKIRAARCPSCGRRSRTAALKLVVARPGRAVKLMLLIGASWVGLGLLLSNGASFWAFMLPMSPLLPILAVAGWLRARDLANEADVDVWFDSAHPGFAKSTGAERAQVHLEA